MPKGLKRYYGRGELHFLTFSCYRRLPLLGTAQARTRFVKELSRVRKEYGFLLVGYVVMPNHVQLLMSEPKKGTPSTVLQMLKQRVSRKMRKKKSPAPKGQLRIQFPKFVSDLPSFWQPRFYDFNVYSARKQKEKLDYMRANPVNRSLVKHPKDWPWSSWSFYFTGAWPHPDRRRGSVTGKEPEEKSPRPQKPRTGHPRQHFRNELRKRCSLIGRRRQEKKSTTGATRQEKKSTTGPPAKGCSLIGRRRQEKKSTTGPPTPWICDWQRVRRKAPALKNRGRGPLARQSGDWRSQARRGAT